MKYRFLIIINHKKHFSGIRDIKEWPRLVHMFMRRYKGYIEVILYKLNPLPDGIGCGNGFYIKEKPWRLKTLERMIELEMKYTDFYKRGI